MIAAQNDQNEWLFFKWKRQPYRGRIGLPSGRLAFGENLQEAAADQLRFKTGYEADLSYIGTIIMQNDGDHIIAQTFVATNLNGTHGSDGLTGESFWSNIEGVPKEDRLSGLKQIIDWANDPNRLPLLEIKSVI